MNKTYLKRNFDLVSLTLIPITSLCVVTLLYLFLPVTPNLARLLNTDHNAIAQLTTCFGLFYAFGFLIWGALSDLYGRDKIISIGLLSLCIISMLVPLYSNYMYLFILRCLQGFFASSFPPVILAWVTENLSESIRKYAISLISCSFLLAGTVGQWFGAVMIKTSIQPAMFVLSSVFLLSAVIFSMRNKVITQSNKTNKSEQNPSGQSKSRGLVNQLIKQIPQILLDKQLSRVYSCALFVLMSFVGLYVILNSNEKIIPININTLRQTATLGMLACLLSSWLLSKVKANIVLSFVLIVMAITLILQYLIIYDYLPLTSIFSLLHFLYVVSIALAIPSMITCSATLSTPKTRGTAVSIYTCILFIGASLGSLLSTYIGSFLFIFITATMLLTTGYRVFQLKL